LFSELHGTFPILIVSYFDCCWFELAMRGRVMMLCDDDDDDDADNDAPLGI
jgi:hypothetical protein